MEDFFEEEYYVNDSGLFDDSSDFTQQLIQIKTILTNSTFNINEIVGKATDDDDDEYIGSDESFELDGDNDLKNVKFPIKEENGRISLAYERLPGIPKNIADKFALQTHTLDLSCNIIRDLNFLANFKILHTLILDNNILIDVNTLPNLPSLRILWLNKCGINQLSKCLHRINMCAPNIRQLSLMGNPCARTLLSGSPPIENTNYIIYVMRYLPNLECLDDIKITDDLRDIVKAHDSKTNQINLNFSKIYPSTPNLKTIWRYDTKTQRSISIQGNIFENLNQMFNSNRHYN